MTSPNPPWAREASYLAASCEEVERGGSREEVLDKPSRQETQNTRISCSEEIPNR